MITITYTAQAWNDEQGPWIEHTSTYADYLPALQHMASITHYLNTREGTWSADNDADRAKLSTLLEVRPYMRAWQQA